jgi:hypothetical protein
LADRVWPLPPAPKFLLLIYQDSHSGDGAAIDFYTNSDGEVHITLPNGTTDVRRLYSGDRICIGSQAAREAVEASGILRRH